LTQFRRKCYNLALTFASGVCLTASTYFLNDKVGPHLSISTFKRIESLSRPGFLLAQSTRPWAVSGALQGRRTPAPGAASGGLGPLRPRLMFWRSDLKPKLV
ncbi:hypothetical protein THAOC_18117, partial [Thalassiosira oceanica]